MKPLLFSLLSAGLLGLHIAANGQSIVAGQTSGVAYTNIDPDRVTTVAGATRQLSDSLDLNLDGTYDLRWTSRTITFSPPAGQSSWDALALIRPLHDNIEITCMYYANPSYMGFILGFNAATVIGSTLPQFGATNPPNISSWLGASTWPAANAAFAQRSRGAAGTTFYASPGDYQPNTDRYMGVRFRATTSSPWRYGWVRVAIQAVQNSVTITVKDYAFEQTILSNKKPAADVWQVYPIPVANTLTLQSSTTGPKYATLLDAQGRAVLENHFTASAPQHLDLSGLPAGMYMLRLTDDKGTVTKRINKL